MPKQDWRIGLKVVPVSKHHVLHGYSGCVQAVLPDGTYGMHDEHGILQIRIHTDLVVSTPARAWKTA